MVRSGGGLVEYGDAPRSQDETAVGVRAADQDLSGETRQGHVVVGPVDEEQEASSGPAAHGLLDRSPCVGGQFALDTGRAEQRRQQTRQPFGAEPGGDVRGRTLAHGTAGHGGPSRVRAAAVVREHVHGGVGDVDPVGPQGARGVAVQRDGVTVEQRPELLDADTEQLAQGARVAAEPDVVVLVDDTGEVRGDEVAMRPRRTG